MAASGARSSERDVEPPRRRCRLTVTGLVQGVGFRPYAYALARELGLSGSVGNAADGVIVEVEGSESAVAEFWRRLGPEAPALARIEAVTAEPVPCRGGTEFVIEPSQRGRGTHSGLAGRGDLLGLPSRTGRSDRPAVPAPVHQLHQLRTALHRRRGSALRPPDDDHGGSAALLGLRRRVRRSGQPTVPRADRGLPGLRTGPDHASAGRARALRRCRDGRGPAPARGRRDRRREGSRRLPPGLRRDR